MKNILNVEDLAMEATRHVENNNLLLAHKCLLDMETCRNELLEELYTPNAKNSNLADIKVSALLYVLLCSFIIIVFYLCDVQL